ncbi:hypothetical protein SAMN05192583_1685 [Sphingomonas gellani]|uniref:Uncharacterized protein n=1 Tax=Sphingomonas gellani TaxID=1166340 RepID=A0A1H8CMU5_9SPHN|nr:hypothetical protein [Sphingomonas gellani]SEM96463.1 hypothetical protein SAMN05192583_1685 [Sphingomonas gellani]
MDLSFFRFDRAQDLRHLPGDLAVLMAGMAARQAASPTAAVQARVTTTEAGDTAGVGVSLLSPENGAFNASMAEAVIRWSEP